jgi:hypothetical protein
MSPHCFNWLLCHWPLVLPVPAFATIHPLSRSENSADQANGTVADTQEPPSLSRLGSQNYAQPVSSVLPAGECLTPEKAGEAQTICGTNPSPKDPAVKNAFESTIV